MALSSVIRLSLVKALALSTVSVSFVLSLNIWPEPVSAQVQCADVVGHLTATPSTIDRETSVQTNLR